MKKPTLAEKLGLEPQSSPLLEKAAEVGLRSPEQLENLSVARGCWHYRLSGQGAAQELSETVFSNEELAIALLSPALPYSPRSIRVGAAMLGADGNNPEFLLRLAIAERTVATIRYIAFCALKFEPENPFWRQLLDQCPECPPVKDGVMPHPTRFVSMTGMTRTGVGRSTIWLRPRRDLALTLG